MVRYLTEISVVRLLGLPMGQVTKCWQLASCISHATRNLSRPESTQIIPFDNMNM